MVDKINTTDLILKANKIFCRIGLINLTIFRVCIRFWPPMSVEIFITARMHLHIFSTHPPHFSMNRNQPLRLFSNKTILNERTERTESSTWSLEIVVSSINNTLVWADFITLFWNTRFWLAKLKRTRTPPVRWKKLKYFNFQATWADSHIFRNINYAHVHFLSARFACSRRSYWKTAFKLEEAVNNGTLKFLWGVHIY